MAGKPQTKEPYAEKRLQTSAIEWLVRERGFIETFSDVEATGARMDSVGILDGRAVAIEVKPSVSATMVRHRAGASGSLEAKIAATLRALAGEPAAWLEAFQSNWADGSNPLIAILAGHYTQTGLAELVAMLQERSHEWHFAFVVWRWNSSQVETLAEDAGPEGVRAPNTIVPALVGSAVRAKARTLAELREIAAAADFEPVFDRLVEDARARGFRILTKRTGLSLISKASGLLRLTVFVTDCDRSLGFNVGIDREWIGLAESELPGVPAPRNGYMNCNRFIRTSKEMTALIRLLVDKTMLTPQSNFPAQT